MPLTEEALIFTKIFPALDVESPSSALAFVNVLIFFSRRINISTDVMNGMDFRGVAEWTNRWFAHVRLSSFASAIEPRSRDHHEKHSKVHGHLSHDTLLL
jgi:hypothetical protein